METFWTLFKESVIIQAIIALTCLGVIAYLAINQLPIEPLFKDTFILVLGFYFGSKSQAGVNRSVATVLQTLAAQDPRIE